MFVKGWEVSFTLTDGSRVVPPKSWGLIHEPLRASLLIAPYEETGEEVELDADERSYLGRDYDGRRGYVKTFPKDGWTEIEPRVLRIFYERQGERAPGMFKHEFKQWLGQVRLYDYRSEALRLDLPWYALVNTFGFVLP